VLYLVGILFVLVPLQRGRRPAAMGPLVRTLIALRPWVMLEVYVLGALVAVVKLAQLASIDLDLGAYAFGLLIVVWTASVSLLDWRDVWERAGEIERRA